MRQPDYESAERGVIDGNVCRGPVGAFKLYEVFKTILTPVSTRSPCTR